MQKEKPRAITHRRKKAAECKSPPLPSQAQNPPCHPEQKGIHPPCHRKNDIYVNLRLHSFPPSMIIKRRTCETCRFSCEKQKNLDKKRTHNAVIMCSSFYFSASSSLAAASVVSVTSFISLATSRTAPSSSSAVTRVTVSPASLSFSIRK